MSDYHYVLQQVVPDWLDKPIINITRDMIAKRHAQYGQTNSPARANNAMRVLRAIFNFAVFEQKACAIPFLSGAGQASPRPLAEIFFD